MGGKSSAVNKGKFNSQAAGVSVTFIYLLFSDIPSVNIT